MGWLKDVIVDVIVTFVIVLVTSNVLPAWADWIVLVYTPFMFLLKAITLFGGVSKIAKKKDDNTPPKWFLHALYAINTATLLYTRWWIVAGQWVLIWLFSYIIDRRQ